MSAMTSRAIRVTSTLAWATEFTARKTRPVEMAPFGRDLGGGVLEEKGVHDRVRKLVADLVGVTAGHGLRREDRSSSHGDLLEPVR